MTAPVAACAPACARPERGAAGLGSSTGTPGAAWPRPLASQRPARRRGARARPVPAATGRARRRRRRRLATRARRRPARGRGCGRRGRGDGHGHGGRRGSGRRRDGQHERRGRSAQPEAGAGDVDRHLRSGLALRLRRLVARVARRARRGAAEAACAPPSRSAKPLAAGLWSGGGALGVGRATGVAVRSVVIRRSRGRRVGGQGGGGRAGAGRAVLGGVGLDAAEYSCVSAYGGTSSSAWVGSRTLPRSGWVTVRTGAAPRTSVRTSARRSWLQTAAAIR